jgi:hypothetical protein
MNGETSTAGLLAAIERIEQTGRELQRAMAEGLASINGARERLLAGSAVSEMVADLVAEGGRDARLKASVAIEAYEHAVMVYRAGLIRAMVDDERLSFAQVARRMEVSRQMIARLYHYDEGEGDGSSCDSTDEPVPQTAAP